jgi:hypothetical protein
LESTLQTNNLLAGRKALPPRDSSKDTKEASKENPFYRKGSEKDLKFRKSAGQLKTTSSK